jgi:hypothetical protein
MCDTCKKAVSHKYPWITTTSMALPELIDRYARAIDGLGGIVQLECNGFDLWGDGGYRAGT